MKSNLKNILYISFCFLAIVNLAYLFKTHFLKNHNERVSKTNQESINKTDYSSKAIISPNPATSSFHLKKTSQSQADLNQPNKIEKAEEFLKKFRKPSSSSFFVSHEFFVQQNILPNNYWVGVKNYKLISKNDLLTSDVVVAQFSNQSIVKDDSFDFDLTKFKKNQQSIVYNTRLKKVGTITGSIKVVTNNKIALLNKLNFLQAEIVNSFDQIQTYYVSAISSEFNLLFLFNELKKEEFISEIEIDIADREYEKK